MDEDQRLEMAERVRLTERFLRAWPGAPPSEKLIEDVAENILNDPPLHLLEKAINYLIKNADRRPSFSELFRAIQNAKAFEPVPEEEPAPPMSLKDRLLFRCYEIKKECACNWANFKEEHVGRNVEFTGYEMLLMEEDGIDYLAKDYVDEAAEKYPDPPGHYFPPFRKAVL